ncbi:DUF4192 domain-containing protein [Yinghuangia seranimata]|uniref:DUF4192 domain-containing protein n=1 Tax=Yinghuangia seranimata TaxID=408067 RepID=UPI00248C6BD8|nr:DUF4192 domain-containing protein [Yinghuangia seranimata]MDI2128669.1 DUF4192 domain-containing protein [Yinghuangia seranimata]
MSDIALNPMTNQTVINVSTPADLIEAVPYLLGAQPTNSLVMVGIQPGPNGRVAPVLRVDLPNRTRFAQAAERFTGVLMRHGAVAASLIVHADAAPPEGDARDYYRPLYRAIGAVSRREGLRLFEAVCVADGRFWSYLCEGFSCCPEEGRPVPAGGDSVVAAAAVSVGLPPPVPLADLAERIRPPEGDEQAAVEAAFRECRARLRARAHEDHGAVAGLRHESIALLQAARSRFRKGDRELTSAEAARLVCGMHDLQVRDHAMSWQDDRGGGLLALWTGLARLSPAPDSAVPLTLAAWIAWTTEQPAFARVAVNRALYDDPDYTMAGLLRTAVNSSLSPEESRRALFPNGRAPRFRTEM